MTDWSPETIRGLLLEKFNLRVSVNDLKASTPEVGQKIYLTFLTAFNFRAENFSHVPINIDLPDPELHQDIMPFAAVTATMGRLLKKIGSTIDFNMYDILSPRPKRFHRILVTLFQFYLFWESRMDLFEPIKKEIESRKTAEQNLEHGCEDLKRRINLLLYDINEAESRVESKNELRAKLEELSVTKERYSREKKTVSAIREQMESRLKVITEERDQLPETIETLRSSVRPSLQEVQKEAEDCEAEAQKLNCHCRELHQKESLVSSDTEQASEKLKMLMKRKTEELCMAKQLLDINKKLSTCGESVEAYKSKIIATEKHIPQRKERLGADKDQYEKKINKKQCQIENRRAELLSNSETLKKPNLELKYLTERESSSLIVVREKEAEAKAKETEFTIVFGSLSDSFMHRHQQEMMAMQTVLQNIECIAAE